MEEDPLPRGPGKLGETQGCQPDPQPPAQRPGSQLSPLSHCPKGEGPAARAASTSPWPSDLSKLLSLSRPPFSCHRGAVYSTKGFPQRHSGIARGKNGNSVGGIPDLHQGARHTDKQRPG